MAKIAKKRGLETVLGVAEFLPFKKEKFDLVLIVTALAFFKDPKQALRETLRVLKPGGQLIAGILDRDSPQGRCIGSEKKEGRFSSEAQFSFGNRSIDISGRNLGLKISISARHFLSSLRG